MKTVSEEELQEIGKALDLIERTSGRQPPSEQDAEALIQWMRASRRNVGLYLDLVGIDSALAHAKPAMGVPSEPRRVEPMQRASGTTASRPTQWRWALAAGFAAVSLALSWAWISFTSPAWTRYATSEGSPRSVELDDGASMQMYEASSLQVRKSAHRLEVQIAEGGATFVAPTYSPRKLSVTVKGGTIEPVRTLAARREDGMQNEARLVPVALRNDSSEGSSTVEFNVLRKGDLTGVHVAEGEVRVTGEAQGEPVLVSAGESTDLSIDGTVPAAQPVNEAQLHVRSSTLAEVAAIFNKRNTVPQLKVVGLARNQPLGGLVHVENPARLVLALRALGIYAIEPQGNTVIIRLKGDRGV